MRRVIVSRQYKHFARRTSIADNAAFLIAPLLLDLVYLRDSRPSAAGLPPIPARFCQAVSAWRDTRPILI